MRILAEDREVTRLGQTVYRHGRVGPEAMDLTARVLSRMAATLREHKVLTIRAVATSAIRDAGNQVEFLQRAQQALGGVDVDVISGQEEARLIQLGVHYRLPGNGEKRLIIDIGGGSAELIESRCGSMGRASSRPLGAVRLTEMFFETDPPAASEIRKFQDYVREKLTAFRALAEAVGGARIIATAATAAATMRAIHDIPSSEKDAADGREATVEQVWALFDELAGMSLRRRRFQTGINARRAEIIVAGCGALAMILEAIGVGRFEYSSAGVRDGIIADLAIRGTAQRHTRLDADQRRTVRQMAERYAVPMEHAEQVARLAGELFDKLESLHGLHPQMGGLLEAAAYLHDIGHFVSGVRHHRHSYYLVANSDLPGFTDRERLLIANLCRYHRKSLPKPTHENHEVLHPEEKNILRALIPLLRIADNLDRGHEQRVERVDVEISPGEVRLRLEHSRDVELELWAAGQQGTVFERTFGRRLMLDTVGAAQLGN